MAGPLVVHVVTTLFLTDSTHHLAGQVVDMVPLPAWFVHQDKEGDRG